MDIEAYCGDYLAKDGRKIPYVFMIGRNNLYLKYDAGDGQREKSIRAVTDENGDISWRLTRKKIYYRSPAQLKHLFTEFDSYASATFRHITGIM